MLPEANLRDLLERFKSGVYRAPPVRRVYIPKGDGSKQRPLGVPTLEDKVLQKAVQMVLEPLYERDFLECSYGFRPGRSAHQALQALWQGLQRGGGGWVLDVDIQGFFDAIDHRWLREMLEHRVRDGVIRRQIDKWLKAGVMEAGQWQRTLSGTPQGGVISPLLANLYLHEVVDSWFEHEVRPRLIGSASMVRFADDLVMVFANEADARRVWAVLEKRLAKHGLTLHPEKTRLVQFRPSGPSAGRSFDFLGFTHYWARSRQGSWVVKRKTAKDRFRRAVRAFKQWCRRYRHWPLGWQWQRLCRALRGHYAYYGIIGNYEALSRLRFVVTRMWIKWLRRRSQRHRLTWDRAALLLQHLPLPQPRIVHAASRA